MLVWSPLWYLEVFLLELLLNDTMKQHHFKMRGRLLGLVHKNLNIEIPKCDYVAVFKLSLWLMRCFLSLHSLVFVDCWCLSCLTGDIHGVFLPCIQTGCSYCTSLWHRFLFLFCLLPCCAAWFQSTICFSSIFESFADCRSLFSHFFTIKNVRTSWVGLVQVFMCFHCKKNE